MIRDLFVMIVSLLVGSILWPHGTVAQSQEERWLATAPLKAADIDAELDVFSIEKTLGGEQVREVKHGRISVGKQRIVRLSPQSVESPRSSTSPQASAVKRYAVELPFTVHPPDPGRLYREVRFEIGFADSQVIAYDLLPRNITVSEKVEQTYGISPTFKFRDVDASAGNLAYKFHFERLRPVISAFGIGEHEIYWIHQGVSDEGVIPETKWAIIILEVPKETELVTGIVSYRLQMTYPFLGSWRQQEVKTHTHPIEWKLSGN